MKICLLNAGFNTNLITVDDILERYWHVPELAAALAAKGHLVTALQAFHDVGRAVRNDAAIEFIRTTSDPKQRWAEIRDNRQVIDRLESLGPDVVHFFGLGMLPLRDKLGRWCAQNGVGLTASFHGGFPGGNVLTRWRQRRALRHTGAVFFSNTAAASAWVSACVLPSSVQIVVSPEVSSPFSGIPKESARAQLGVDGHPVIVWAARLHSIKDPLTAIRAWQRIIAKWPDCEFLMAYQSEEMLVEINAMLSRDQALQSRVKLLGALQHSRMEALFSAADFFVLPSVREWGSNALVEAMSCGAIPVVSDIPSLRALTAPIGPALLFPVGDYETLAGHILAQPINRLDRLRHQVRLEFMANHSYAAIAEHYHSAFVTLTAGRSLGARH